MKTNYLNVYILFELLGQVAQGMPRKRIFAIKGVTSQRVMLRRRTIIIT